jgi:glycosyltransferase involved in cell wall biosynthesis
MGNLLPIKGFHLTVRAFAKFARSEPSSRLVIVGEGPLRPSLEELVRELGVQNQVEFTGRIARAAALERIHNADAFLFPSSEVAGMVVLEAMAHGVPVVGLRGAGVGEMVPDSCGFVVEQGSLAATIDALAYALERLSSSSQLRERMAAECRRVVRERYLWEHRHEAIREWYRRAGMKTKQSLNT